MDPMIAAFLTCFGTFATLYFLLYGFWALFLHDCTAADETNDENMVALQPILIPNGHSPIGGQIDWQKIMQSSNLTPINRL